MYLAVAYSMVLPVVVLGVVELSNIFGYGNFHQKMHFFCRKFRKLSFAVAQLVHLKRNYFFWQRKPFGDQNNKNKRFVEHRFFLSKHK